MLIDETNIDPKDPRHAAMLGDLQGNILKSNGREHAIHMFLHFKDGVASAARQWIQEELSSLITSANQQITQVRTFRLFFDAGSEIAGDLFVNFMISAEGYRFLGEHSLPATKIPNDPAFLGGAKSSIGKLNDPAITDWEEVYRDNFHALLLLADDDTERLEKVRNLLRGQLNPLCDIIHEENGANLRDAAGRAIEHFGYADGISQPLFLKDMIDKDIKEQGNPTATGWDPTAPLKLVLVEDPNGDFEHSFGTYCVYRKLEQDVDGFKNKEQELATKLGVGVEQAGAMAVGRFKDGTPKTLFFTPQGSSVIRNNFNYNGDALGQECPFHAHIRKTNPRLETVSLGATAEQERAHRIVRRAIPYGKKETKPVGLLFICLQSNIGNQFEFMQASWANDHNFVKPGVGLDAIVGQGTNVPSGQSWTDSAKGSKTLDFSNFVKMKGGEYWFMPSISCLKTFDAKLAPTHTPAAKRFKLK